METCCVCSQTHISGTIQKHDGDIYCSECLENATVVCKACNDRILVDDAQEYDDDNYCQDCYDDIFSVCEGCEETVYSEITICVEDRCICEACCNNNYCICDDCGEYVHNDNVISDRHTTLCVSCYENGYFICEDCNELLSTDHYAEDGCCISCWPEETENGLHDYGYRPTPQFYGKSDLHFGIELEMESNGNDIGNAIEQLSETLYAKHDGSLHNGLEVVSHPTSWDWLQEHKDVWGGVLKLSDSGFRSYNTSTCGMHVHMSKAAFTSLHLYKFLKLFFENPNFILIISRRHKDNLQRWASAETDESLVYKAKTKSSKTGRYTAVNLQNSDTVEIRIFRGTLSPTGFWRNVEFCKAVFDYTKQASVREVTTQAFCQYVKQNHKEFPNLAAFIEEKNLCV